MGGNKYDEKKKTGFFVTFEGIDGTGKTTQFNLLANRFRELGLEVVLAKEPGDQVKGAYIGSELGKHVRQILFFSDVNTATGVLDEEARDLLFLADHIQLWRKTIVPALSAGKVVICDRYGDSQLAYAAGKNGSPWIDDLYRQRFGPMPDATVLLIGDPEFLSSRAKSRQGTEAGKQDGKSWASNEGQLKIRDKYVELLKDKPRTVLVDVGTKRIEIIAGQIWSGITALYTEYLRRLKFPAEFRNQADGAVGG
jgi:dTMP kinase